MTQVLEALSLGKSYKQGDKEIKVLEDLNLTIAKGESVAIIGPSGSGKSTLLSVLAGLDNLDKGKVLLAQKDLALLSEEELALFRGRHMGIVFQDFNLLGQLTAIENVSLPLEIQGDKDAEGKAKAALEMMKLSHRMSHRPHELSGGEKQRVAIARAFAVNPSLLLADEPSGNLDYETGEEVMSLLFERLASAQSSLLLVTHNRELAARCQRSYTMQQGKLKLND